MQPRQHPAVPPAGRHLDSTRGLKGRTDERSGATRPTETAAFAKGASRVTQAKLAPGRVLPSLKSLEGISRRRKEKKNELPLPCLRSLSPLQSARWPRSDGGRLTHLHIIPDGKFLPQYSRLRCCHITARPRGQEQVQLVTGLLRLSFHFFFFSSFRVT